MSGLININLIDVHDSEKKNIVKNTYKGYTWISFTKNNKKICIVEKLRHRFLSFFCETLTNYSCATIKKIAFH